MIFKYFHLGLRQVVMALMDWAIDVPQELLQSDAKTGPRANAIYLHLLNIYLKEGIAYKAPLFYLNRIIYL